MLASERTNDVCRRRFCVRRDHEIGVHGNSLTLGARPNRQTNRVLPTQMPSPSFERYTRVSELCFMQHQHADLASPC